MVNHAVHWSEGLFLHPHHFQASDRQLQDEIQLSEDWHVGYAYGLRKIEIDEAALANWEIKLRVCHARFRDGTHICYPEAAILNPINLPKRSVLERQDRCIGLSGHSATAARTQERGRSVCRRRRQVPVSGRNRRSGRRKRPRKPADAGRPRGCRRKLIVGDQDIAGYEAIPLMRLRRGTMAESPPEIDRDYIPPILACDAWSVLQDDILSSIYHQVGSWTVRTFGRRRSLIAASRSRAAIARDLGSGSSS